MLTHIGIWQAIDRLAKNFGFTPSGLAKQAGLDPTAFNKSKRFGRDGRPRWPSTESVAKVLQLTGAGMQEFAALVEGGRGAASVRLPVIGLAQAGSGGYFDDAGHPAGHGWGQVDCPGIADPAAYALAITGESMLPAYREGDLIVVSPAAEIRRGDRVVTRTTDGEIMAKVLARRSPQEIELHSFNPNFPPRILQANSLAWMARIVWASQ